MPVVHDALTGPDAIHPAAFVGADDPALTPTNQVGPLKLWIDTTTTGAPIVKMRNLANDAWVVLATRVHADLAALGADDHPQYVRHALVDAKGDLLVASGADAVVRLPLGLAGSVLTASPTATEGLVWAPAPPALTNPMTSAGDLIVGGASGEPGRLGIGADGEVLGVAGGEVGWVAPGGGTARTGALAFTLGNGTDAIAASEPAQWVEVPFDCTITGVTLTADVTGSLVCDVQVEDYASYPPDAGDSVCAAAKPTLASAIKAQDLTLTGWTTTLVRGQFVRVVVDSASVVTRALLSIAVEGE